MKLKRNSPSGLFLSRIQVTVGGVGNRHIYVSFKALVEFKGNFARVAVELAIGKPQLIQLVPQIDDVAVHFGIQGAVRYFENHISCSRERYNVHMLRHIIGAFYDGPTA